MAVWPHKASKHHPNFFSASQDHSSWRTLSLCFIKSIISQISPVDLWCSVTVWEGLTRSGQELEGWQWRCNELSLVSQREYNGAQWDDTIDISIVGPNIDTNKASFCEETLEDKRTANHHYDILLRYLLSKSLVNWNNCSSNCFPIIFDKQLRISEDISGISPVDLCRGSGGTCHPIKTDGH